MNPERWTIDGPIYQQAIERLRRVVDQNIETSKAFGATFSCGILPAYYDNFCRRHFISLHTHRPSTRWEDVAPLYALAAAAYDPTHPMAINPRIALIEMHYDKLKGESLMVWKQGRLIMEEAWSALLALRER